MIYEAKKIWESLHIYKLYASGDIEQVDDKIALNWYFSTSFFDEHILKFKTNLRNMKKNARSYIQYSEIHFRSHVWSNVFEHFLNENPWISHICKNMYSTITHQKISQRICGSCGRPIFLHGLFIFNLLHGMVSTIKSHLG